MPARIHRWGPRTGAEIPHRRGRRAIWRVPEHLSVYLSSLGLNCFQGQMFRVEPFGPFWVLYFPDKSCSFGAPHLRASKGRKGGRFAV